MSIFLTLLRRELGAYFLSLTGYVVIAGVTLLIGSTFAMLINNLGSEAFPVPVTALFFNGTLYWIIVILVSPVITMRLFAMEKATGTYETLMTAPVGDIQVVAAKFTAALFFYMVMWLPSLACFYLVAHFAHQANTLENGLVGAMYLGIFLTGAMFLAIGCFTSSVTRSQVTAAMMSLAMGTILFILAYVAYPAAEQGGGASWLYYFNLFKHVEDFTRGVVDTRAVIFYLSAAFLFLFFSLRAVESRRWK